MKSKLNITINEKDKIFNNNKIKPIPLTFKITLKYKFFQLCYDGKILINKDYDN